MDMYVRRILEHLMALCADENHFAKCLHTAGHKTIKIKIQMDIQDNASE